MNNTPQLCVSVDIGCRQHSVAIGLPNGDVLDEFATPGSGLDSQSLGSGLTFDIIVTLFYLSINSDT